MKLTNNMLGSFIILIAIITISEATIIVSVPPSDDALEKIGQPIVRTIDFHRNRELSASWGGTASEFCPCPKIFVLNYKEYADTFEEFMQNYPNFTLNTYGEVISDSTFGDVGKNKFGKLSYVTDYFIADDTGYYTEIVLANAWKSFAYSVSVNIRIGFLIKGYTNLYLLPYLFGEITSQGAYNRNLVMGLNIDTITFHPKGT
ncbi:hypothetical protein PV327_005153 [Microctonus hyperodae]|uniref:Uncharacterized protein n=1 Tax=Microctonus hyperodae TaxID=165561 RepID=A0AA39KZI5_MICHY|nr:hypothetical protein PV327_005153 [Microctonus hyperodae]